MSKSTQSNVISILQKETIYITCMAVAGPKFLYRSREPSSTSLSVHVSWIATYNGYLTVLSTISCPRCSSLRKTSSSPSCGNNSCTLHAHASIELTNPARTHPFPTIARHIKIKKELVTRGRWIRANCNIMAILPEASVLTGSHCTRQCEDDCGGPPWLPDCPCPPLVQLPVTVTVAEHQKPFFFLKALSQKNSEGSICLCPILTVY
jgi:hypothetical protein